jgi:hypothetical protein
MKILYRITAITKAFWNVTPCNVHLEKAAVSIFREEVPSKCLYLSPTLYRLI